MLLLISILYYTAHLLYTTLAVSLSCVELPTFNAFRMYRITPTSRTLPPPPPLSCAMRRGHVV